MNLSLKSKILLVLIFFLLMLALLSLLGYQSIDSFTSKSRTIMEDNYVSVGYAAAMQEQLNTIHEFQIRSIFISNQGKNSAFRPSTDYKQALLAFEAQLMAAEKNVTETFEEDLLDSLETDYRKYLASFRDTYNATTLNNSAEENIALTNQAFIPLYNRLKELIGRLHQLNMQAIVDKSRSIRQTGEKVSLLLSILGIISFTITLAMVFFLPGYLANPLVELKEKIQEIIHQNFDQKLELRYHAKDEVGELAASFNHMASQLKHYEESNLSQVWFEKRRTEAVLQILKKAIIVLDQEKRFLHVNKQAEELIGLSEKKLRGQHISQISDQNQVVRDVTNPLMISQVEHPVLEKDTHEEVVRIQVEDKERVFKRDMMNIFTKAKADQKQTLVGYVIVLEKVFG